MPLYKISYDIYKVKNAKMINITLQDIKDTCEFLKTKPDMDIQYRDLDSEIIVVLYHDCDRSEIVFKFDPEHNDFTDILRYVNSLHIHEQNKLKSRFFKHIDETNLHMYGKISIDISHINISGYEGNIFAAITLEPYRFTTKSVINSNVFNLKQSFYIPVHNRFDRLKLEVFSKSHSGFIQKKTTDEKLCEFFILLPDILNNDFPNRSLEIEMDNSNKSIKATKVSIIFKLRNYSNLFSILERNRNKNIIEDMNLLKSDDNFSIKMLMKRMKKIIILIKEFKEYYKMLFRWKYPVFSGLCCICLLLYVIFSDINYFLTHLILFMLFLIFVHSNSFKQQFSPFCERFIYGIRNPYDFDSAVTTKVDIEADEVKKNDYLVEEENKQKKTNMIRNFLIEPIKSYKNIKASYHKALYTFTKFVSVIEKFKNLFLWTDPLLTFYFFILGAIVFLVIYSIKFKYLMIFAIISKFYKGMFFFKKKYCNNQEVAKIILENSYKEWQLEHGKRRSSVDSGTGSSAEIDLNSVTLTEEKLRTFIKEQLEKHGDLHIQDDFLNSVKNLGEIKDAISKCKALLKVKKVSSYYHYAAENPYIYKVPLDIDLIFYYFLQNIKSDYYISKYYKNRSVTGLDGNITLIKGPPSSSELSRKER
jgi:hypothetical protein